VTSCETIPGLKEPSLVVCTLIDTTTLDCVSVNDPNLPPFEIKVFDAVGFLCASPDDYGAAADHHNALHLKIKELMESR
jgi:hypothetical protein